MGLLHEEMRRAGSLILAAADATRVPAGSALAVDREAFSGRVEAALAVEPLVSIVREEVAGLPPQEPPEDWDSVILATGPLTSPAMAGALRELTGEDALAFFDAIAPVVYRDSIDFSKAWYQSRYDKGEGRDYINCPLSREEYAAFIAALLAADAIAFKDWEADTPYFEGCLPVEVMAGRGAETLTYGPMKPVGLTNPHAPGVRSHAVVQLRQDNALGSLYNMVGFQTKLRHAEQVRVFRMIPGLERAEFARLGGLHRNTFVNSPRLLDASLRLKARPGIRLAGQITGCEGYVESAAIGLLAGRFAAAERRGEDPVLPPPTTALGALLGHITGGAVRRDLPADERQLRPVPAASRRRVTRRQAAPRPRAQAGPFRPGARRPRRLAVKLWIATRVAPLAVATTTYSNEERKPSLRGGWSRRSNPVNVHWIATRIASLAVAMTHRG